MTVGVVALCEGGKAVVLAADRQFTSRRYNAVWNTCLSKISDFGSGVAMIFAGASVSHRITGDMRCFCRENTGLDFDAVVVGLCGVFNEWRLCSLGDQLLSRYGYDTVADFRERCQDETLLKVFAEGMEEEELLVELLLAHIGESGANVGKLISPGKWIHATDVAFIAVGSGEPHACRFLGLNGYSPSVSVDEALQWVFAAKKAAEVSSGVGEATDIAVLRQDGLEFVGEAKVAELERSYEAYRQVCGDALTTYVRPPRGE